MSSLTPAHLGISSVCRRIWAAKAMSSRTILQHRSSFAGILVLLLNVHSSSVIAFDGDGFDFMAPAAQKSSATSFRLKTSRRIQVSPKKFEELFITSSVPKPMATSNWLRLMQNYWRLSVKPRQIQAPKIKTITNRFAIHWVAMA